MAGCSPSKTYRTFVCRDYDFVNEGQSSRNWIYVTDGKRGEHFGKPDDIAEDVKIRKMPVENRKDDLENLRSTFEGVEERYRKRQINEDSAESNLKLYQEFLKELDLPYQCEVFVGRKKKDRHVFLEFHFVDGDVFVAHIGTNDGKSCGSGSKCCGKIINKSLRLGKRGAYGVKTCIGHRNIEYEKLKRICNKHHLKIKKSRLSFLKNCRDFAVGVLNEIGFDGSKELKGVKALWGGLGTKIVAITALSTGGVALATTAVVVAATCFLAFWNPPLLAGLISAELAAAGILWMGAGVVGVGGVGVTTISVAFAGGATTFIVSMVDLSYNGSRGDNVVVKKKNST